MDLAKATAVDFENLLEQKFQVRQPAHAVEGVDEKLVAQMGVSSWQVDLELVEVDKLDRLTKAQGETPQHRSPFSLLFFGPHDHVLASSIYTLVNENTGPIEIFLNPVDAGEELPTEEHPEGRFYEACFN